MVKRCRYRHDVADLAAPAAGSTGDNHHGLESNGIAKPVAGGTGGNRNGLGIKHHCSNDTRNDSTLRVGNVGADSSTRAIVARRGNRDGGGGRGGSVGGGGNSGDDGTASTSFLR